MLNTAEFEARGPAMVDVVADFVSSAVFLLKSVIAEASVCNRVLSEFRLSPTVIATVALDEEVVFLSASMLSPGIALVKIFVSLPTTTPLTLATAFCAVCDPNSPKPSGKLAVALAAVNVFGGFLVTRRMLEMFKKKK